MPSQPPLLALSHTDGAAPFLKWLGGKRWLVELGIRVPVLGPDSTYFEPFVGAGSLFFALRPERAELSDINSELINSYRVIQTSTEKVIDGLLLLPNTEEAFLRARAELPHSDLKRAVRFIYLNRTAYGGMYRVNRHGQFNVPYGNYTDRRVCQPTILRQAAQVLSAATVREDTFAGVLQRARRGDVVYFDPPYDSRSSRELFGRYSNRVFTWAMHEQLAEQSHTLAERGVHVLVSNTAHPDVCALYKDFFCTIVKRRTYLSRDPTRRGLVEEAIFASYPEALPD